MKKTTTLIAAAAAVVLLPGLLVACSGAPSGDATDKASGGSKDSGSSLSSCMRDKGYDMPDPDSGSRVQMLSAPDGVDEAQWRKDLDGCMGDAGAGEGFQKAKLGGTPEQQKAAAECIRKNGFSDYPDGEDAMMSYKPDDEKAFQDASSKCFAEAFGSDEAGESE